MVKGSPNPWHIGLPARLRKARKRAGLTRAALGPIVGLDADVTGYIESGRRLPKVGTVARLALGLAVPAGWLAFGIGDPDTSPTEATPDDMGIRLAFVRNERGLTKAALARSVNLSPSAFAKIENGGQTGVDVLAGLAKALGVSPAWLAYGEGAQTLPPRRRIRIANEPAHAAD